LAIGNFTIIKVYASIQRVVSGLGEITILIK